MTIQELNEKFNKRYTNLVNKINSFVNETALIELGDGKIGFNVPTVSVSDGGSYLVDNSKENHKLPPPAKSTVSIQKVDAIVPVYRVLIPYAEVEIAMRTDSYFNYLFDAVVDKALAQYAKSFGAYDELRFGEYYAKFMPLDMYVPETLGSSEPDSIVLRIEGKYAARK